MRKLDLTQQLNMLFSSNSKLGTVVALLIFAILHKSCSPGCSEQRMALAQRLQSKYSAEALEYYAQIAFGTEFGKGSNDFLLRWHKDVKIKVFGKPKYATDSLALINVVKELNEIIEPITISFTTGDDYNVRFDYTSIFEMEKVYPLHEDDHSVLPARFRVSGFFGKIRKAQIVIIDEARDAIRVASIWEEVTQILGLMQDRDTHLESIFYESSAIRRYNEKFAEIDKELIRIHYNEDLPNMDKGEFIEMFKCQP